MKIVLRIKSLYIDKFKGFTDFNLEFNDNLTVMVGLNGTGKTTILETINNILLENILYFEKDKEFTFVEMKVTESEIVHSIKVERKNNTIEIIFDGKSTDDLGKYLNLDKLIYAPTEVNFMNVELEGAGKLDGEQDKKIILDSVRMSKQLKQFLVNEKYKDLNDIAEGNREKGTRIEKFKTLYNNFFDDKEFIGIDNNTYEPQFRIKENNEIIKVEDLSAGEKQIFFRGGSLLQNLKDNTIVLLDEPETSMHPEWQQRILDFYKNINNKSQYIVSTHSPHIAASTLPDEIRVLERENGKIVVKNIEGSYGRTVSEILISLFELKTLRNEKMESDIKEFRRLFFNSSKNTKEEQERLEKLQEEINEYLDPNDPDIAMIEFEKDTIKLKEKLEQLAGDENA